MKVILDGILINAISIERNEALISKKEAKRLVRKHPQLDLLTRNIFNWEFKLSEYKPEELDSPGIVSFFVRGYGFEKVGSFADLKSLNKDLDRSIIRAMRAELLRIGRTVYGQELQENVRLTIGDRQVIIHSLWKSRYNSIELMGVDGRLTYLACWNPSGTFEEKLGVLRALKKVTRRRIDRH